MNSRFFSPVRKAQVDAGTEGSVNHDGAHADIVQEKLRVVVGSPSLRSQRATIIRSPLPVSRATRIMSPDATCAVDRQVEQISPSIKDLVRSVSCSNISTNVDSSKSLGSLGDTVDLSKAVKTDCANELLDPLGTHRHILQKVHELIDKSKTSHNENMSRLKDNFESRFCAMETFMKLQHNLLQTTFDNRICALEEKQHDIFKLQGNIERRFAAHEDVMAENLKFQRSIERRLSANEEVLASVPELQEFNRRHNSDKRDMAQATASIELQLHCLEEHVRCLSDDVSRASSEDKREIKKTHPALVVKHAVTRGHTKDSIQKVEMESKLTTGSNIPFEQRLLTVESNINLIVSILKSMEAKLAESSLAMPSQGSTSPQVQESPSMGLHSTAEEVAQNGHAMLDPLDDLHQDPQQLLQHGCYTILE